MASNPYRVRWGARGALTLGVVASVTANVLHAHPQFIAQAISAWPPLAFLITVELIAKVPAARRALAVVRYGATAVLASIAAWVSYWHMAAVASRYGETGPSPYLIPLVIDGMILVASISLVELADQIRAFEAPPVPAPAAPPVDNSGQSLTTVDSPGRSDTPPDSSGQPETVDQGRPPVSAGVRQRPAGQARTARKAAPKPVQESAAVVRARAEQEAYELIQLGEEPTGKSIGEKYRFGDEWGRLRVAAARQRVTDEAVTAGESVPVG